MIQQATLKLIQTSKVCSKCKEEKELNTHFYFRKDTNKFRNECNTCRNTYNLELYHTSNKQKENHRKASWKYQIKKNYNMTPDDYYTLLDKQNSACKICGIHLEDTVKKSFYIDHCHTVGTIRGLLCHNCNTGLGMFKDNTLLLDKAKEYLNEHSNL